MQRLPARDETRALRVYESAPGGRQASAWTCCRTFSAAYVHHLFRSRELLGSRLATIHNLRFYQRLMERMRQAILGGAFDDFQREFLAAYVPTDEHARQEQRGRWRRTKGQPFVAS